MFEGFRTLESRAESAVTVGQLLTHLTGNNADLLARNHYSMVL